MPVPRRGGFSAIASSMETAPVMRPLLKEIWHTPLLWMLIIAITALRAGQYMLVKASIAGAIVTNALFMLGVCLLLGGLRYHVQEYNRAGARLNSGLLLMAAVALLTPSSVSPSCSSSLTRSACCSR